MYCVSMTVSEKLYFPPRVTTTEAHFSKNKIKPTHNLISKNKKSQIKNSGLWHNKAIVLSVLSHMYSNAKQFTFLQKWLIVLKSSKRREHACVYSGYGFY